MDGLDNRTDGHGMIDGQAVSFLFLRVFSLAFPWRRRPLNRLYYPHLWSFTLLCTCARLLLFRLLAPGRHTLVLVVAGRDTLHQYDGFTTDSRRMGGAGDMDFLDVSFV
jgi:hypothetical protein